MGCRRTAAVPGPPPHDRSVASGSRVPLMPCRGWLARERGLGSGKGREFLASDAEATGSDGGLRSPSGTARLAPSGSCCSSSPPEVARSGGPSVGLGPFIRSFPPPSSRFPPPLLPWARPALPTPLAKSSVLAFPHKHFANFQALLSSSAPEMDPPDSPLVTGIK